MDRLRSALLPVFVTLGALGLIGATQGPERQHFDPRSPGALDVRPFSGAVRAGGVLYLSGTLGVDANRRVPEDPEQEARLVMDGIRAKLELARMTMDDLVSVQVFCSDVSHYDVFNRVYRTYFTKEFPARAFIGSGKLLFDARFEVQGIAVKR